MIWLVDVPLAATHHLRHAINTGKAIPREVLERYEIPIVASALKLYLLELPGKIVQAKSTFVQVDSNLNDSTIANLHHRLSCFLSGLRNHKDYIFNSRLVHFPPNSCFGPTEYSRPITPCKHCHPRRPDHTFHPPHRAHFSRRILHLITR